MVTAPILIFLDWKKGFHVHVEVSCISLGVVLTQAGEGELDHPIAFASRKLSKAEKNYSTMEHEGLATVEVLQNFRNYFLGRYFKMYTDHFALKYLVDKPVLGGGYEDGYCCFKNVIHFLTTGTTPEGSTSQQKKELVVCVEDFSIFEASKKEDECAVYHHMTEYLTNWAEAQPVKDLTRETTSKFLFEYVLTRFGCPKILMSDHGTHFLNETISVLMEEFQVYHQKSTPYHPQANGIEEAFNIILENALKKVCNV
eukprot:PITA_02887